MHPLSKTVIMVYKIINYLSIETFLSKHVIRFYIVAYYINIQLAWDLHASRVREIYFVYTRSSCVEVSFPVSLIHDFDYKYVRNRYIKKSYLDETSTTCAINQYQMHVINGLYTTFCIWHTDELSAKHMCWTSH